MGNLYRDKPCIDCGKVVRMHIKSKRCKDCQRKADAMHNAEHRRAKVAGRTRLIGSQSVCEACGKKYIVNGGKQRYCPDCAPDAVSKNIRREACARYARAYSTQEAKDQRSERRRRPWQGERVCKQCGASFSPQYPRQACCSEACQIARTKSITRESDRKRRQKNKEEAP